MIRLTALIQVEGQEEPRIVTHESDKNVIIIGRGDSVDFTISVKTASRRHARVEASDGVYTIQDLRSGHGTILNGKRIDASDKRVLRDGAVIEIGEARITCSIEIELTSATGIVDDNTQARTDLAVRKILGTDVNPFFKVLTGSGESRNLPLEAPLIEWTIGRSKDCELLLEQGKVSREHARVTHDWRGYTIHDLGSKNGVQVNDEQVQGSRLLRDLDEVCLGAARLAFVDPNARLTQDIQVPGFEVEAPETPEARLAQEEAAQKEPEDQEDIETPEADPDAPDASDTPDAPDEGAGDGDGAPTPEALDEGTGGYSRLDPVILEEIKEIKPPHRIQWLAIALLAFLVVLIIAFVLLVMI